MIEELCQETVNTPETLGTTPRYVLQHNTISRSAHNLSATAKKITAMAMALLPPDLSSRTAAFTFAEFCHAIGYDKGGESFKLFVAALKECGNAPISIEIVDSKTGKKTFQGYHWFSFWEFREETGVAVLTFSPELVTALLELKRVYAKINLQDMGDLQSKYAIRIFELAVSYMSLKGKGGNREQVWYFERDLQELRQMLGIPDDTYQETRDFRKYVVENPVKEINAAGIGVEISTTGVKQGRKLAAIRFDCQNAPRTTKKRGRNKNGQPQSDLPELTTESYEDKTMQHLKEMYPDEFAEFYAEELAKPSFLPPSSLIRQGTAEAAALARLREKHGLVK